MTLTGIEIAALSGVGVIAGLTTAVIGESRDDVKLMLFAACVSAWCAIGVLFGLGKAFL